MVYKITELNCIKLLTSIGSELIFINGIIDDKKYELSEQLKGMYNVYICPDLYSNPDRIKRYISYMIRNISHVPIAIVGELFDENIIDDIFSGRIFTYIWIYPNSRSSYKNRMGYIDKNKLTNYPDLIQNSEPDNLISELLNYNKTVYNRHLEYFNNRIITVLI